MSDNKRNPDDDLKNILEFLKRPENAHLIDQPTEVVQEAILAAKVTSYDRKLKREIRSPYSYIMTHGKNPKSLLNNATPDEFARIKSERMQKVAYYEQALVNGSVRGITLHNFMENASFDEDGKEIHEDTKFEYNSLFLINQAIEVFQNYTTTGSSPLERYKVFATIAGFAGENNIPVSIFEMDMLLGIKQNTFSRHLWSLQEPRNLGHELARDLGAGFTRAEALERFETPDATAVEAFELEEKNREAIEDIRERQADRGIPPHMRMPIEPATKEVSQFGLIRISPHELEQDGRRKYFRLTEKGLKLASALKEIFHNAELPENEGSDDTE